MAPNSRAIEISDRFPQEKGKERQEIFYNGFFYDVTDFINRHPGGNVIRFYTESGEDASQAIEQFHYRSKNKVDTIMKSFKKRPGEPHERGLEPSVLSRHDALSADFKKLFEEIQAEGLFEPSIPHVLIRSLEAVALTLLALGIFFECKTLFTKFLATILTGFALSRYGWIQHEGGHNSLTGRPKIDKFIQNIFFSFTLGGSPMWWNSQHNRHHAMPQRLEHDVDLATLPYVAFNKRTVKDSSEIYTFFVRFQGIFYWTLDLLVAVVAWRFVLHPRYSIRKKAYHEILLGLPMLFFCFFEIGLFWYILMAYWFAFFLGINFALNHSHLDVADKPTHWIEYSLTHTVNVKPSLFVDYFMGYLNYQIEHHIFPTMPQFRNKEVTERGKALAEKHGLSYRAYSYPEAVMLAIKNLNNVGKDLTSKQFSKQKEI